MVLMWILGEWGSFFISWIKIICDDWFVSPKILKNNDIYTNFKTHSKLLKYVDIKTTKYFPYRTRNGCKTY